MVYLRTARGDVGYLDGMLTVREGGQKTVTELATAAERDAALAERFGIRFA